MIKRYLFSVMTIAVFIASVGSVRAETKTVRDQRSRRVVFLSDPNFQVQTAGASADSQTLRLRSISGLAFDPVIVANKYLSRYGKTVGISSALKHLFPVETNIDEDGIYHVRYEQRELGTAVFGADVIVHISPDGLAYAASIGTTVLKVNTTRSKLSRASAIAIATARWKLENPAGGEPEKTEAVLNYLSPALMVNVPGTTAYLTWAVKLRSSATMPTEVKYFVDALSGTIRWTASERRDLTRMIGDCTLGTCATQTYSATYNYYFGRRDESFRNHPTLPLLGTTPRGPNPIKGGTDVDDAYDILPFLDNFVHDTFKINGANRQGGTGDGGVVLYDYTRINAYPEWSGYKCPQATFSGGSIYACPGYIRPDILGHEYGHAIAKWTDSLTQTSRTYSGQSGALEESYADLMGEAFEYYMNGTNDWLVGPDNPALLIRNLKDPPATVSFDRSNLPDTLHSPNYYCGSGDKSGVHWNATVPGKAGYLLGNGESHVFNGCTVPSIGMNKTQKIFFKAMNYQYNWNESFNGAYPKIIQTCKDIYGISSATCKAVERALQAVELNQSTICDGSTAVPPECSTLPTCEDTDAGITPASAGGVIYQGRVYEDTCVSGLNGSKTVNEWYCNASGIAQVQRIDCANSCSAGKCI